MTDGQTDYFTQCACVRGSYIKECSVLARKVGWWFLDQSIFVVLKIISDQIRENLL